VNKLNIKELVSVKNVRKPNTILLEDVSSPAEAHNSSQIVEHKEQSAEWMRN
jgi:hypothetical protein